MQLSKNNMYKIIIQRESGKIEEFPLKTDTPNPNWTKFKARTWEASKKSKILWTIKELGEKSKVLQNSSNIITSPTSEEVAEQNTSYNL